MMEHTTDRLFWTLTSVIVGALILTIGVNAFPKATQGVIQPISGVIKQADTSTKNVKKAGDDAIAKETGQSTGSTNSSTQSNTNSQPTDPDASAKANAVEASTLGFTITDNGDGTGTITNYDKSKGNDVNIPSYMKLNGKVLKITVIGSGSMTWQFFDTYMGTSITSVTIPDSVTTISDNAFNNDSQLKSITFGKNITSIGDNAFYNAGLTNITLPNSLKSIGYEAFAGNKLTSLIIPNSVTNVEAEAFASNSLSSVQLSNNMSTIKNRTFAANQPLRNITIPNSVTSIEDYAFWNCSFSYSDMSLPASVTNLGKKIFGGNNLYGYNTLNIASSQAYQQAVINNVWPNANITNKPQ